MSYSDILSMPTYERRFFIGMLTKDVVKKQEQIDAMKEQATTKNSKGSRTTRVSGDALKSKIKSGNIPTT
jgi:hypothetical protein